MRKTSVMAAIILFASGTASAQSDKTGALPYAGKWKLNFAKSDFGETTIAFTKGASGQMQFTAMGQSYAFHVDGKDYPALFGRTAAWKQIDANTWETTIRQDGKLIVTETTTLSGDGKALTVTARGPRPAGGTFEETAVYERLSGGPGLEGQWKTKNIKASAPTVLELAPSGTDGLTIRIPDFQVNCEARFDGKDYPATGPTVPPGLTIAISKSGPRSFDMTEKKDGKEIIKLSFEVSDDGKTLIETGGAIGTSEKFKAVYDRQ